MVLRQKELEKQLLKISGIHFVSDENGKGLQGMLMQKVTHPPRLADASLLVIESLNSLETPRKAWVYSPGTRRVRRAPDIAYDYIGSSSQGLYNS